MMATKEQSKNTPTPAAQTIQPTRGFLSNVQLTIERVENGLLVIETLASGEKRVYVKQEGEPPKLTDLLKRLVPVINISLESEEAGQAAESDEEDV